MSLLSSVPCCYKLGMDFLIQSWNSNVMNGWVSVIFLATLRKSLILPQFWRSGIYSKNLVSIKRFSMSCGDNWTLRIIGWRKRRFRMRVSSWLTTRREHDVRGTRWVHWEAVAAYRSRCGGFSANHGRPQYGYKSHIKLNVDYYLIRNFWWHLRICIKSMSTWSKKVTRLFTEIKGILENSLSYLEL